MRRLTPATVLSLDGPAVPPRRRWVPPRWWRPAWRAVSVGVAMGIGAGIPAWAWHAGVAQEAALHLSTAFIRHTAAAGLRIEDVLVEGREHTRVGELIAALQIERGDPILGFDLAAAKDRVEALPWVREAALERRLPNVINVRIIERKPIALWQNQGAFMLVDAAGTPIPDDPGEFAGLPLVVGDDAPQHAANLIGMLQREPQLMARVKAAVRVSARRWNLQIDSLEHGISVRLPEDDPAGAWQKLAQLEREHRLLERSITAVDLRQPDRLVLRKDGPEEPIAAPPSKKKVPGKDA